MSRIRNTPKEPPVDPAIAGTPQDPRGPGFVHRTLPNGQIQFGYVRSYPPADLDRSKAGNAPTESK